MRLSTFLNFSGSRDTATKENRPSHVQPVERYMYDLGSAMVRTLLTGLPAPSSLPPRLQERGETEKEGYGEDKTLS